MTKKHAVLPAWPWPFEKARENFWEPFSGTTGIGMSKPRSYDMSEHYGIKGEKVEAFRVYGLENGEHFLPLRVCIEFSEAAVVFDRGSHNLGNTTFFDPKTLKRMNQPSNCSYVAITYAGSTPDFFSGKKFPFGDKVKTLEKTIVELSGATISELKFRGNHTLAAGWLVDSAVAVFEDERYVSLDAVKIHEKEILRTLGKKCASQIDGLYVLEVQIGDTEK